MTTTTPQGAQPHGRWRDAPTRLAAALAGALVVAGLWVTGGACAADETTARPTLRAIGFEMQAPAGAWTPQRRPPPGTLRFWRDDAARGLVSGEGDASIVVEVRAERLRDRPLDTPQALADALRWTLEESTERYRYEVLPFEPFAWQGTDCLRYRWNRRGPIGVAGEREAAWSVDGWFCRHPLAPQVVVFGLLQERRPPDEPPRLDEATRAEARTALETVRFLPLR